MRLRQITGQLQALSEEEQWAFEADVVRKVEAAYRGDACTSKTFRYDTQTVLNLPKDILALLLAYEVPRATAVVLARVHSPDAGRRIVVAVIGEGLSFRDTLALVRAHRWNALHPIDRPSDPAPQGLVVDLRELLHIRPQLPSYPSLDFLKRADLSAPEPVAVTVS